MVNNDQKIQCPQCNAEISIDAVLTHQIEEKIRKNFAAEQQVKEQELVKQKQELEAREQKLAEAQKANDIEVNKKVAERVAAEKLSLWKKALAEAEKSKSAEVKMLEEQLKDKDQKLSDAHAEALKLKLDKQNFEQEKKNFELEKAQQLEAARAEIAAEATAKAEKEKQLLEEQLKEKEARLNEAQTNEIELRKEKNRLAQEKKDFELEKQRQLDEERKSIEESAAKKAAEAEQFKIAQLEKKLNDALRVNEEQKRKLEQGSQQMQGEVLELELEELLKREFPHDEIVAVPKGVHGVDIIQKVFDMSGQPCGQIAWESKKTKGWQENWVQKLKDNQRRIKADLAVIVSSILPAGVDGFIFRDTIWICDVKYTLALATALRMNLLSIARERGMSEGKNEKMEILYSYLTGVEFRQRVEAIVEAFTAMQDGLKKERLAYEKIWSEREKQIHKVISNTVGMYGDISGLVTLPQIKTLELESGDQD